LVQTQVADGATAHSRSMRESLRSR
jgi:hypothetical protein